MWLKNYKYTAKPEGQDPVGKIGSCLKFTVPFSIMVSGHDIFIQSQCTTLSSACKRLLFWTIPINGMGFIFPTVTLISTRIRGKNDPLNHVMGALAATQIIRSWLKLRFHTTVQIAVILGSVAFLNKGFREDFQDMHGIKTRPIALPQNSV
ncbi:uncharacterized protein LOC143144229 [Ptiloglossa arizonensis]|uniref:uncharacterized protein LOC143144229 n=1 Tax=Ptiloglossa arizonensis TaxID=3350558 RepID=UPI003F9F0180